MKVIYRNGQKFIITDSLYESYQNVVLQEEQGELFDKEIIKSNKPWNKMDDKEKINFYGDWLVEVEPRMIEIIKQSKYYSTFNANIRTIDKSNEIIQQLVEFLIEGLVRNKQEVFHYMDKTNSLKKSISAVLLNRYVSDMTFITSCVNGTEEMREKPEFYKQALRDFISEISLVMYEDVDFSPTNQHFDNYVFSFLDSDKNKISFKDSPSVQKLFIDTIELSKQTLEEKTQMSDQTIRFQDIKLSRDSIGATLFLDGHEAMEIFVSTLKEILRKYQYLFKNDIKYIDVQINGEQKDLIDIESDMKDSLITSTIPQLIESDMYDINKIIRELLSNYRQQQGGSKYAALLEVIRTRVQEIEKIIGQTEIKNKNFYYALALNCKDIIGVGLDKKGLISYENDNFSNINIIRTILEKQDKAKKILDAVKYVKMLYNAKKVFEDIEKNDYYTLEQNNKMMYGNKIQDIFAISKEDTTSKKENLSGIYLEYILVTLLIKLFNEEVMKQFNNLTKQQRLKLKSDLQQREKLEDKNSMKLLNDIKNMTITEFKNLQNSKDKKFGLYCQTLINKIKEFPRDKNLIKFIQLMNRNPTIQNDKKQYNEYFDLLRQYQRLMETAEENFLEGLPKLGLLRKEFQIREVQTGAVNHLLKNKNVIDADMNKMIAYSYLTECYNEWWDYMRKYKIIHSSQQNKNLGPFFKMFSSVKEIVPHINVQTMKNKNVDEVNKQNLDMQITLSNISKTLFREILVLTDVDLRDVTAAFTENELFNGSLKSGNIKFGEEGEGNPVFTIPILKNNKCIGAFRLRKMFARTQDILGKVWNHGFTKSIRDMLK